MPNNSRGHVGANDFQNFPISLAAVDGTITGGLSSTASTTFRVEFFSSSAADPSGFGQGQTYLEFVMVTTS